MLKDANLERDKEKYKDLQRWDVMHWACALAGEAGELANKAKKIWKLNDEIDRTLSDKDLNCVEKNYDYDELEQKRETLVDGMAEELADVLIYADLLAQHLNVNLEDALIKKFNLKSKEIKSTVFFGKGEANAMS